MTRQSGKDCDIARALKAIGDRWVLLIIRDLFFQGHCRFSDFLKTIDDINPTTLSNRLKQLEDSGLIERRIYSERPPRAEYHLTEAGKDLKPVLIAMMEWGRRHRGIDLDDVLPAKRHASQNKRRA
ncbi:MAG: helix-turn-helix domain-containing protein [Pseudomonadota bacterium]